MKRVQEEITATQQRVEAKKKEILTEEHLKIITTFQTARLKVFHYDTSSMLIVLECNLKYFFLI